MIQILSKPLKSQDYVGLDMYKPKEETGISKVGWMDEVANDLRKGGVKNWWLIARHFQSTLLSSSSNV